MSPSFHTLATVASVICVGLTVIWLMAPKRLLAMWSVSYTSDVGLVSRRGAALFLGMGIMFFLARNAELSPSRVALSAGFIVACLALALLGIFELTTIRAGIGILSAVLVEFSLAAAFLVQLTSI